MDSVLPSELLGQQHSVHCRCGENIVCPKAVAEENQSYMTAVPSPTSHRLLKKLLASGQIYYPTESRLKLGVSYNFLYFPSVVSLCLPIAGQETSVFMRGWYLGGNQKRFDFYIIAFRKFMLAPGIYVSFLGLSKGHMTLFTYVTHYDLIQ